MPTSKLSVTLKSLLAAWVTLIFGTSLLLFLFAPVNFKVYNSNYLANLLTSVWEIGDAMGPAVKLSLIALFGTLVFTFQKNGTGEPTYLYLKSIVFALVATLLVLAFLPADYSRGFGIGLTGSRFDGQVLAIYLIGSVLGGAVYAFTFRKLSD